MSKKVYLSPSTQEKNIGAGNYGTEEYRANLICNTTEKELKRHGITVYRNKPTMTLTQVVEDSNNKDLDIHFAIHTNAYNKKSRGAEGFCYKLNDNKYAKGYNLIKSVYTKISAITPTADRGIKQGYNFYGTGKHMYELAYTKVPAALIEIAFHDNIDDATWIINNMDLIGITIAKGILEYFGVKYITEEKPDTLFYVQAGAFRDKQNAENLVSNLKKNGFDAIIIRKI